MDRLKVIAISPDLTKAHNVAVGRRFVPAEFLARAHESTRVFCDGEEIPREKWIEPITRGNVVIMQLPRGEGAGRLIVKVVALTALALSAGAILAAVFFAGSALAMYAISAVILALTLPQEVRRYLQRQMEMSDTGTPKSLITSQENQLARYSPIPRVYGEVRFAPPLAAFPYTSRVGQTQYMHILLCLGYGPLEIGGNIVSKDSTMPITSLPSGVLTLGDTDYVTFGDVEFEIGPRSTISLINKDIFEESINADLNTQAPNDYEGSAPYTDNVSFTATSAANTVEIAIDLYFPQGLWTQGVDGKTNTSSETWVDFNIEYSPSGTGIWTQVSGGNTSEGYFRIYGPKKEPFFWGTSWTVAEGTYDVRVTRVRSRIADHEVRMMDAKWLLLRSTQSTPDFYGSDDHILCALKVRTTDRKVAALQQIKIKCTSVLDVWDGTQYVQQATRNPAWVALDIMTGEAHPRPLSRDRVDIATFKAWADWLDGLSSQMLTPIGWTHDWVHNAEETALDRLRLVTETAFAAPIFVDGKLSITYDSADGPVKQVLTPRNAMSFTAGKAFTDLPDMIRVQYADPDVGEWNERVVVKSGGEPTGTERTFDIVHVKGITRPEMAWLYGMYFFRNAQLRPEEYVFDLDFEHLPIIQGDHVRIAHDVLKIGLHWGRVVDVSPDGLTVTLDEPVDMVAGDSYGIVFRLADGTQDIQTVVNSGTTTDTITLNAATTTQAGDLFVFGYAGQETLEAVVASIEYKEDLTARVKLRPSARDLWNFGSPPVFNPLLSQPVSPFKTRPNPPTIHGILSDESVLLRDNTGALRSRIVVSFRRDPYSIADTIEARYRRAGTETWMTVTTDINSDVVSLLDVEDGAIYEIQLRAVNGDLYSEWTNSVTHTVVGKTTPPPDVTGFQATPYADRVELNWSPSTAPDVAFYRIKEGTDWTTATLITDVSATAFVLKNPSNGPWLIKAIDVAGNESINATQTSITVTLPTAKALTAQVIDNNVLLRWQYSQGTFKIDYFDVLKGVTLDSAEKIGESTKTFDMLMENKAGDYVYWVRPVDAAGNAGTAVSVSARVSDPPDFVFHNNFALSWRGTARAGVQIRPEGPLPGTRATFDRWGYTGRADVDSLSLDVNGNTALTIEAWVYQEEGDEIHIIRDVSAPDYGIKVLNGVLFAIMRTAGGATWQTFTLDVPYGKWSRVAVAYDSTTGNYTAWVDGQTETLAHAYGGALVSDATGYLEIDTADESKIADVAIWDVAQLPANDLRYTGNEAGLRAYWRLDDGSVSSALDYSVNDAHLSIYNVNGWWTPSLAAYVVFSGTTPQDQINAGINTPTDAQTAGNVVPLLPAGTSGYIEEEYDTGGVIASSKIIVSTNITTLRGAGVSGQVTISVRETTADSWVDFQTGLTEVYATNFRYVKIRYDFTGATDSVARIEHTSIAVQAKQRSDSGVVNVVSNPTAVNFNVPFIDVESITATAQDTAPRIVVVDFNDVPNPTGFSLYLYDQNGNDATGTVRWSARGV